MLSTVFVGKTELSWHIAELEHSKLGRVCVEMGEGFQIGLMGLQLESVLGFIRIRMHLTHTLIRWMIPS